MSGSFNLMQERVVWVADTGLFVACGRQQNNKYTALERFAQRNDLLFVIQTDSAYLRLQAEVKR